MQALAVKAQRHVEVYAYNYRQASGSLDFIQQLGSLLRHFIVIHLHSAASTLEALAHEPVESTF